MRAAGGCKQRVRHEQIPDAPRKLVLQRVYERQTRVYASILFISAPGVPVETAGVMSTTLHPGGDSGGCAEAAAGAMAAIATHTTRLS